MTLVVALKGTDGILLASDSREVHSDLTYNDKANKIFPINNHVAVALAGEIDYIVPTIQTFQQENADTSLGATEIADNLVHELVDQVNEWGRHSLNPVMEKVFNRESPVFGVVIAGYDKVNDAYTQQKIYAYNFGLQAPQEILEDYYCEGYKVYAKVTLASKYTTKKNLNSLIELAKVVIKETADKHVGVGGPVRGILLKEAGSSEMKELS
jgi:20S proteasome alpha/beta subunit